MNIPYEKFYAAENSSIKDTDAISSATNKVGNYGKAGGSYHSETTVSVSEDGTITAVGKENGAKAQGVTWAVKAENIDEIKALGGTEITDSTSVTTATVGKGQTSSNTLSGYQALNEAPEYSYYILDTKPSNYLILDGKSFVSSTTVPEKANINAEVSYSTNWGDVELDLGEAENANGKIINAVIVTAEDGTSKGFYHIGQIWAYNEIAWNVDETPDLDGKKITSVRYYCTNKDEDLTDGIVPSYENYVYDYTVALDILTVYTGEVSAEFKDSETLEISGLPQDILNPQATVSSVVGRGETAVIIAENADVADGTVKTESPAVFETTYKITVTSENYGDILVRVPCTVENSEIPNDNTDIEKNTDNPQTCDIGYGIIPVIVSAMGAIGCIAKKRS